MDIENLVTMANQIGSFYATLPDRNKALDDIAGHIGKYWDPRMRRELLAYVDAPGRHAHQLIPIVRDAILLNRAILQIHQ